MTYFTKRAFSNLQQKMLEKEPTWGSKAWWKVVEKCVWKRLRKNIVSWPRFCWVLASILGPKMGSKNSSPLDLPSLWRQDAPKTRPGWVWEAPRPPKDNPRSRKRLPRPSPREPRTPPRSPPRLPRHTQNPKTVRTVRIHPDRAQDLPKIPLRPPRHM